MNECTIENNAQDEFNSRTMKRCNVCGKAIAKSAKTCPNCGAKNKKPLFKRVSTYVILIILLLAVGIFVINTASRMNLYQLSDDAYSMTEKEYKAACKTMSYKKLARSADNIVGKKVKFTGKVFQVVYEGDSVDSEYLISVTKDEYDFFDDNVEVFYNVGDREKLLEDDIVTFYGEVTGSYTYKSTGGANITVPAVNAVYIDIEE